MVRAKVIYITSESRVSSVPPVCHTHMHTVVTEVAVLNEYQFQIAKYVPNKVMLSHVS